MNKTIRIGSIFNVDVSISLILLIFVIALPFLGVGSQLALVFLVFMVHEGAHALVARLLKMKVGEIELLPFGGAVRIESVFELNPLNEIYIAIAGPGANIILLLGYSALQSLGFITIKPDDIFLRANLILAGFNLLPALPLDGGRILRAILSREIGFKRATNISAYGGLILAIFLFITGFYALYLGVFNPSLFLIAGFLTHSALKEKRNASYIFIRDVSFKRDILTKEGMLISKELVVLYDTPLKRIINNFVPHRYHFIKVVDQSLRVWGYLDETQIMAGILDYGINTRVGRLLDRKAGG